MSTLVNQKYNFAHQFNNNKERRMTTNEKNDGKISRKNVTN